MTASGPSGLWAFEHIEAASEVCSTVLRSEARLNLLTHKRRRGLWRIGVANYSTIAAIG